MVELHADGLLLVLLHENSVALVHERQLALVHAVLDVFDALPLSGAAARDVLQVVFSLERLHLDQLARLLRPPAIA